jgi:hypothetical protein
MEQVIAKMMKQPPQTEHRKRQREMVLGTHVSLKMVPITLQNPQDHSRKFSASLAKYLVKYA